MSSLRLRKKIFLSLLAATLLFALGMVMFAETVIYHKLHNKLREKGVALAKKTADDCINHVITERYFEITMMFKDLMDSEDDIVYAFVLGEDGRELAHTFANGVPQELKLSHQIDPMKRYSTRDLSTDRGTVHDIAVPLLKGQIGVLHLGLSDDAIRKDVNDIVVSIVLFSVFILITGTALSIVFSRTITRPLIKLSEAAEAFGRGDTEQKLMISSGDEIGELAQIFNAMVEKRKQNEEERERLIIDLQTALKDVKTLSGMLPICASCKKVRDDKGYWSQIELYIDRHTDAQISHGICPDCAEKLYPEYRKKTEEADKSGRTDQNDPENS